MIRSDPTLEDEHDDDFTSQSQSITREPNPKPNHHAQDVGHNLEAWRSTFEEAGGAAPGARPFKSTAKEFLRRTQVFLESPSNSQPGL